MWKLISVFLSSLTLIACGGGSDSSEGNTNSGGFGTGGSGSPNSVLTLTAMQNSACSDDTPSTNAKLIIHNDDFSERTVLSPNAMGVFNYETQNNHISVSLITYREIRAVGIQTDIKTFIDVPVTNLGTFTTTHVADCQCSFETVTIASVQGTGEIESAWVSIGASTASADKYTASADEIILVVNICHSTNEEQIITGTLHLTDEEWTIPPQTYSQGMTVNASVLSDSVSVNIDPGANAYIYSYIDGTAAYRSRISLSGENIGVASDPSVDYHSVRSTLVEEYESSDFSQAHAINMKTNYSRIVAATNDMSFSDVNFSEIYSTVIGESNEYNFSHLSFADSFQVTTALSASSNQFDILSWTINMPVSGSFPNVDLWDYSSYVDTSGALLGTPEVLSIQAHLYGYKNILSYDELFLTPKDTTSFNEKLSEYELASLYLVNFGDPVVSSPVVATQARDLLKSYSITSSQLSEISQKARNELMRSINNIGKHRSQHSTSRLR